MPSIQRAAAQEFFKSLVVEQRRALTPAARERKKTLRSSALWRYPVRVEKEYYRYIRETMALVRGNVIKEITDNLKRWLTETDFADGDVFDEYEDEFTELIEGMRARQTEIFVENPGAVKANVFAFGAATNAHNAAQWAKITTLAVGPGFSLDSGWVPGMLQNWSNLNFNLIQSLTDEYIKKVNFIVADGVQQGRIYTDIMKDLRGMDSSMNKYRSELIARDQIGKLNGSLTEGRLLDAGIREYIWSTALDERVRPAHRKMNGSRNKWDDRGVYVPRGGTKYISRPSEMQGAVPGSQVLCRCTGLPAFDDIVKEADELITKEEKANPAIRPGARNARRGLPGIRPPRPTPTKTKAPAKKTTTIQGEPKTFKFKNNAEGEAYIRSLGPQRVSFGRSDVGFAEGMASALSRVPKGVDLSDLHTVGDYSAITSAFGAATRRKKQVAVSNGVYLRYETAKQITRQGVFMSTRKSTGKTIPEVLAGKKSANAKSRGRVGHDWFMSETENSTAHHEVGHYIFQNKHGKNSAKNRELRDSWRATVANEWPLPRRGDFSRDLKGRNEWEQAKNDNQRGEYSRTNNDEAFAEAWSAYVEPSQRKKLPSGVVAWIKKEVD